MITLILSFIQFLLISYICYYEYKLKSSSIFMWLTVFLMFGLTHLITTISENKPYPIWVLDIASIFVILFCLMYLFTRRLFLLKTNINIIKFDISAENKYKKLNYFDYILLLIFIIIVVYKNYLIYFNIGFFDSSWSTNREIFTREPTSNVILWFYFISSGILLITLIKKRMNIFFIVLIIIIINTIISRNRIEIIPVFIALLSYLFFWKKFTYKKLVLLTILSFLILYCVNGLIVFRHFGTIETFISSSNFKTFNNLIFNQITISSGELGLKDVFYYFIYNNNEFPNFEKGHTYIRMLLVLIPTNFSFGIKPPDFAISMGYAVNPYLQGFSTHPTLFGDCYANFGLFGFLLGIFWAIFFSVIDYLIKKNDPTIKLCLFSLCSTVFIFLGRGSVYNSFSILIWGYFIIIFIYKISYYITKNTKIQKY